MSRNGIEYMESRLSALIEQVRARRSVYALAAVCDACQAALVDEPLFRTRRPSPSPTNRLTAEDLAETAERLHAAHFNPDATTRVWDDEGPIPY